MPIENCMAACPARRSRMSVQGGCGQVARTAKSVTTMSMSTIGSIWASLKKPTTMSVTLRFFLSSMCILNRYSQSLPNTHEYIILNSVHHNEHPVITYKASGFETRGYNEMQEIAIAYAASMNRF